MFELIYNLGNTWRGARVSELILRLASIRGLALKLRQLYISRSLSSSKGGVGRIHHSPSTLPASNNVFDNMWSSGGEQTSVLSDMHRGMSDLSVDQLE